MSPEIDEQGPNRVPVGEPRGQVPVTRASVGASSVDLEQPKKTASHRASAAAVVHAAGGVSDVTRCPAPVPGKVRR